jgi:hypothetical protein
MPIPANPGRKPPEHGARLSTEEFQRRIVALHEHGPAMPSRAEELRLQRAEFDLRIDHRLGKDFPPERRQRLWEVHRRFDRHRLWHLFKGVLARNGDPSGPLASALVRSYAKELEEAELLAYFDLSEDEVRRLLK